MANSQIQFQAQPKATDEILDYAFDWSAQLSGDGDDTITASVWTVETIDDDESPLTIESESNTTTITTVWLSGGTLGRRYQVSSHITTAADREFTRSFILPVKQR